MIRMTFAALALLAACTEGDPAGLTEAGIAHDWSLVTLNGQAFAGRATLDLTEAGRAAGQAPCNRYFGARAGALPEFRLTGIGATRMACADLSAEDDFLKALGAVQAAALEEGRLVLTGPGEVRLEFALAAQ
ncbi:MAG: META domain-containing protein [Gemmobacter sp.]|jgi:heat shock protein HslJ|nr:META domain-containing protein [Gemmobacter sp.]